jgi:hypothetical protein
LSLEKNGKIQGTVFGFDSQATKVRLRPFCAAAGVVFLRIDEAAVI